MKPIVLAHATSEELVQRSRNDGFSGSIELTTVSLSHCLLHDKYLCDVTFHTGEGEHCRFEYCNLRNSVFDRVNLTDSRFIACDLRHARFENCVLWYVTFERCELNYDSVLRSLPPENNIRRHLLGLLRANAESMGEKQWADKLLLRELGAEREDLRDVSRHSRDYYKKKYDALDRVLAVGNLALHYAGFALWGDLPTAWLGGCCHTTDLL